MGLMTPRKKAEDPKPLAPEVKIDRLKPARYLVRNKPEALKLVDRVLMTAPGEIVVVTGEEFKIWNEYVRIAP